MELSAIKVGAMVGVRHNDIPARVLYMDGPRIVVRRKYKPYGNAPRIEVLWPDEIVELQDD